MAYWSHVTKATRTWGGGNLDKVFSSLGAPLGHFWSAFMKPTDYVTRAPILTRRGRRRKVVVEV